MYRKTPRTLTENECESLLRELRREYGNGLAKRNGLRNHLAALLMLDAGLRVAEVRGLLISDLMIYDEPVERLMIRKEIAKGGRERTVPMTGRLKLAVGVVYSYYWFQPAKNANHPAFPGIDPTKAMTIKQLERIIILASVSALHRHVTPHVLRHTFGTRVWRRSDIRIAQTLLGHKNLASTQIYTHPDQEDLDKAIHSI